MQKELERSQQVQSAVAALHDSLGENVLGIYLCGTAGSGRLQPQSDIDMLAVVDRSPTDDQRKALLAALLQLSGRHPAKPNGPRCLDISVFCQAELAGAAYPARAEFAYGEWLRDAFKAGSLPAPARDPENTLILAQVRREALALFGPSADALLPDIPPEQIRQGMRDALPALMGSLHGDERNVLLTLARMWRTAKTGAFVTKDAAAEWAIPQIDDRDAATLEYARKAYLGEVVDAWSGRSGDARRLAECLSAHVTQLL